MYPKHKINDFFSMMKNKFHAFRSTENLESAAANRFVKLRGTFFYYSGLKFIWRKFVPVNKETLPTGFIWLIGVYVVFFWIGSIRYDNRVDIIENRANAVYAQISSNTKMALERIPEIQSMRCPTKPIIYNPLSILQSFYKNEAYREMTAFLSKTIEDWKDSLSGINLSRVNIVSANLEDTNLQKINFSNANLSKVNFSRSNLSEANLSKTDLRDAYLNKANLRKANLTQANLKGADLSLAILKETFLSKTDLRGAIFFKANLEKSDLSHSNLKGAILFETNFKNANLTMADFTDAENITADQLCQAKSLYKTVFNADIQKRLIKKCPHLLDKGTMSEQTLKKTDN